MRRRALVEALEIVRPALAKNDLIEVLTCACFTGTHIIAYDDDIGIELPLATPFAGAVRGSVLRRLLAAARGVEVRVAARGDELAVACGKSATDLPVMSVDEWRRVFDFDALPTAKGGVALPAAAVEAVGRVLVAASDDKSAPDHMGVTLVFGTGTVEMFATDASMIGWAPPMPAPGASKRRDVISLKFAKQLVRLSERFGPPRLRFLTGLAVATFDSGVRLFGRLIDVVNPEDFHATLEAALPKNWERKLVPISVRFARAIERSVPVVQYVPGDKAVTLTVEGNHLTVDASSHVRERIKLDGEHADIADTASPEVIQRALGVCTHMLLTDRCLVMADRRPDPRFVCLVATASTT